MDRNLTFINSFSILGVTNGSKLAAQYIKFMLTLLPKMWCLRSWLFYDQGYQPFLSLSLRQ